ncbi:hypothetical protein GCM10010080_08150 [Thermomonas carbonis]|nr:hypothetical protein GCM10010080_08150 [Thermomonas carbonis]
MQHDQYPAKTRHDGGFFVACAALVVAEPARWIRRQPSRTGGVNGMVSGATAPPLMMKLIA